MNKYWNRCRLVLPAGVLLAMLVAAIPVSAQPDATPTPADSIVFGARPADGDDLAPFRFDIAAGGHAQATLIVSNDGDTAISLRTHTADIDTRINGGYEVVPEGSRAPEEAAWLSISQDPYLVQPGEEIELHLEIVVPSGTESGEYMAAVATETTESTAIAGTDAFRQITRKVNAVVITVPGTTQTAFELGEPSLSTSEGLIQLTIPVRNTGNTRVKPTGTITIAERNGEVIQELEVAMGSVYAWDSTIIQITLAGVLPPGDYVLSATLSDPATGVDASLSNVALIASESS